MLDHLSPEEQRALLELLIYMAKADGKVMDVEQEILHQYADLVDVDFDSLDGTLTPADILPLFESPVSRTIALQEIIRLSHLDGYFADDERAAILDIADEMGFDRNFIAKIDAWVVDGLRWVLRGEELLDEAEEME